MRSQKLELKLFVERPLPLPLEPFVPVFHRWVKEQRVPREVLIDVADYMHVSGGPAVLLVGHGSDYAIDMDEQRAGLVFRRKRDAVREGQRFVDGLRNLLGACVALESEASLQPLAFATGEILVRVPDRLSTPNTDAALGEVRDEIAAACDRAFAGAAFGIERIGTEREPFSLIIRSAASARPSDLLERL